MKSLTLFRHAKTEPDAETGRDFDRRLNERGRKDAPRMGEEIRRRGLAFDLEISSPAARAAETATLAGLSPRYDERIYDASADEILTIIQGVDDAVDRLLLVGHNPGFERLGSRLLGQNVGMPTGSLLEISLPVDQWRDVRGAVGRLILFVEPKELG